MIDNFTDYYELLEIRVNAPLEEIKKAFRSKAKKLHPDVNRTDSNRKVKNGSDSAMKLLLKGYAVLKDPEKRREYDRFYQSQKSKRTYNYRDYLKSRQTDFFSQSELIFYDLLFDKEDEALKLYERLESDNISIQRYMDREDFMDCAFLLAEEYEKKKEFLKAFSLFFVIAEYEKKKPYFRHFMAEVVEKLKNLGITKLNRLLPPLLHIEYLEMVIRCNVSEKLNALFYKKIAEIFIKLGNFEKARYYLGVGMAMDPSLSGIRKLREKMAAV